ncbi:MAG TPA: cytochrome P450 [Actinomycetota bacterium]|nr:cytochrome P450 [Actinomycetota bacterium]
MGTRTVAPALDLSKTQALRLLRRDPIRLIERAAAVGDVVRIPVPRVRLTLANHPDLAWDVLSTGARDFRKSPAIRNARRVLGRGLLTSEGELHRRQRRLIQPIFHHDRIDGYSAGIVEEAERAADRLPVGATVDVHEEMARLTLTIVARALFGSDLDDRDVVAVGAAMHEVLSQFDRQFSPWYRISSRLPLPSTRRFDRSVAVFDDVIRRMIARRRAEPGGEDLLSLLLAADEDGAQMDDAQVRDEAVTLFLAGHETTSNALTWTWWALSQDPEAERRLRAELDAELGGRAPALADLPRLPFLRAVLQESIRLRPPAWLIGREAVAPHDLWDVPIAPGEVVLVSPWLLHHDERWWPDPEVFRPDRWLHEDPDRPRHAYVPFGGGARMCIGEGFAELEALLVLATLARRHRFELDPGARVELQPVITLRPRNGMPMRVAT